VRIPASQLREWVALPADATPEHLHEALVSVGFEEEDVHPNEISGPIVVGEVLEFTPEPQDNGKTINWCQVRVATSGDDAIRGIVCGASNFEVGDKVVVVVQDEAQVPSDAALSIVAMPGPGLDRPTSPDAPPRLRPGGLAPDGRLVGVELEAVDGALVPCSARVADGMMASHPPEWGLDSKFWTGPWFTAAGMERLRELMLQAEHADG
jgi:hypothetical protein